MAEQDQDASVPARIRGLAAEEHALFERESLEDAAQARVRAPEVVKKYVG